MDSNASSVVTPIGAGTFSSAMTTAHNYMKWVLDPFRPFIGKHVLEVGMGHGGYVDNIPHLHSYTGLDIAQDLVLALQLKYPDRHYVSVDITSPVLQRELNGKKYDTVMCLNVLEHIEQDRGAIQGMIGALQSGGHLMIFVPAFQFLYSEMDKLAGHYKRYTKADFRLLFAGMPVQIVKSHYFNALGGIGWWINKLNKPKTLNDPSVNGQLAFFDKWLIPVARVFDFVMRPFFGQSLVVIIRKD